MEQKQCNYKKDRMRDIKESLAYRNHKDFTSQLCQVLQLWEWEQPLIRLQFKGLTSNIYKEESLRRR